MSDVTPTKIFAVGAMIGALNTSIVVLTELAETMNIVMDEDASLKGMDTVTEAMMMLSYGAKEVSADFLKQYGKEETENDE